MNHSNRKSLRRLLKLLLLVVGIYLLILSFEARDPLVWMFFGAFALSYFIVMDES